MQANGINDFVLYYVLTGESTYGSSAESFGTVITAIIVNGTARQINELQKQGTHRFILKTVLR
jgi:hypothetical protein